MKQKGKSNLRLHHRQVRALSLLSVVVLPHGGARIHIVVAQIGAVETVEVGHGRFGFQITGWTLLHAHLTRVKWVAMVHKEYVPTQYNATAILT